MMRVAVDGIYFGVSKQLTPEQLVELTVCAGADGLNWPFHENFLWDDAARVGRMLEDAGLAAVSLGLTVQLSATPGAEGEYQAAFLRCARMAQALGCKVIDCWPRRPPEVSKEDSLAVLRGNLEAVAPIAAEHGCVVAIEFEPGTAVENYREAAEMLSSLPPPVKATADSYHIVRVGDDLAAAAAALDDRIGILHFSGSHRGEPGSEGDACDYAAFVRAAREAGFQGDAVLQYQTQEDLRSTLSRAVAHARRAVAVSP